MNHLYKIFALIGLLAIFNQSFALNDSVNVFMTNFSVTGSNPNYQFHFDIFTRRLTPDAIPMGSSTFVVKYTPGTMNNPVLSNINPKYNVGSASNSYDNMGSSVFFNNSKVAVQIMYIGGPGENISDAPGLGERIATVTLDVIPPASTNATVQWDLINSYVTGIDLGVIINNSYFGSYNGPLPVELSSFTSVVNKNSVVLNWTTLNETNNSGFEIERKSTTENSTWITAGFVQGSGNSHESKNYTFNDRGLNIGSYNYRLKQIDFNGNFEYFNLENEVLVGVPSQYELSQNYPNPFNPSTKINFSLPNDAKVSLLIYDISGRLVSTLISNEFKSANYYTIEFNAANLASGTYFYSLQTDSFRDTKKMLIVK